MLDESAQLDQKDELAGYRYEFYVLHDTIYLDGNSLGLMSRPAEAAVLRVLDEWRRLAVGGWANQSATPPWFFLAEELGRSMAPLVGACSDEVIITNSTTVNLHQLLYTLIDCPDSDEAQRAILTDSLIFPSDRYAIESYINTYNVARGSKAFTHKTIPPRKNGLLNDEDLIAGMTPDVTAVLLPSVVYTTGQLLDIEKLASEARKRGLLFGLDLSHSIGAIPHRLNEWGVDFAFWCGYKYLNGGPGATGGLYINRRHFGRKAGLAGWFGSNKQVQLSMPDALQPADGAGALQIGTPNILSMAPLSGTLQTILAAGIDRIRMRSLLQTKYMMSLIQTYLQSTDLQLLTPLEDYRRGGHVAIAHPEAMRICKALKARGIVPDFRTPNIVRLCPAPLYTSFTECRVAIETLTEIVHARAWESISRETPIVP